MTKGHARDAAWWSKLGRGSKSVCVAIVGVGLACAACGGGGSASGKSSTSTTTATSATVLHLFDVGLADSSNTAKAQTALRDFNAILAISSNKNDDLLAEYDIGVVQQRLGKTSAAFSAYKDALAINPDYRSALYNVAVLETTPSPTTAAAYYKRLLKVDPHDANVDFNYGLLLDSMGQKTAGNAEIQAALKIDPSLASRLPSTTTTTTK